MVTVVVVYVVSSIVFHWLQIRKFQCDIALINSVVSWQFLSLYRASTGKANAGDYLYLWDTVSACSSGVWHDPIEVCMDVQLCIHLPPPLFVFCVSACVSCSVCPLRLLLYLSVFCAYVPSLPG